MTRRASKVLPLERAIAETVRPGMSLHFALAQARPNAAIRELLRQFAGRQPHFTASATGFGGPQLGLFLAATGLLDHLVTGFVGDQYPRVGPNSRANRLIDSGELAVDAWSLLTFLQRLKAAALGTEWTVTASLATSDIAREHPAVRQVDELTLVRALRPDITFLHAVVADEEGNAVLSVPTGEGILGAAAARRGAIVTVERIVSRDELRAAAGVPVLPGALVRAVCPARYGAHPSGVFAPPPFLEDTYADDYAFIEESTEAHRLHDAALREWITTRLLPGPDRATMERLRDWNQPSTVPDAVGETAPTPEETMAAVAGRLLLEIAGGSQSPAYVLTGIGVSSLAAWLARDLATAFPPLISEVGLYDYLPKPGNPFLFNFPNLGTVAGLTDTETILGVLVQGHGAKSLGVLAAGQLDRHGNINSTRTSRGWITGSGGANDIASGTHRNIVLVPHRPGRLVPDVEFITSPGRHVDAVVTDRAVLQRHDGELMLTAVIAPGHADVGPIVRDVVAATPWPITVRNDVARRDPPTAAERQILRSYDPRGFMLSTKQPH